MSVFLFASMRESDNDLRMRRALKSNVPAAPLRWGADRAAVEFGMSANTLRKALNKESIACGADGCFSTQEICRAVFGGLNEEKLLTQRQLTRKYELENSIVEASVLNRSELTTAFAALADAMRSRIIVSGLTRDEKADLLRDLASIPVVCDGIAKRQTRLPRRSKNGQKPEVDQNETAKSSPTKPTTATERGLTTSRL
jgi:hypothetical protein